MGHDINIKKTHYVNWKIFRLPMGKGGIGIISLFKMNSDFIMRLGWKLEKEEIIFVPSPY